jgi:Ca2+-binding RTX toxin-like protein
MDEIISTNETTGSPVPARRGRGPRRALRMLGPLGLALAALALTACEDGPGTVVEAVVKNGTLVVDGTDAGESISLRLQPGDSTVVEVDVGTDGIADFAFDRDLLEGILVRSWGGTDLVRVDMSNGAFTDALPTRFEGGEGIDILVGGNGAETLAGGGGDDIIDGGTGADTMLGDAGADTFSWDPGDASDVVTGGADTDHLEFNGSGTAEIFDVSMLGVGRTQLTRNVGSVVMDIGEVETVDLHAVGGIDVVNVGDLTGTHIRILGVDFNAAGGGDDAANDEITVASGLALGYEGSAATVDAGTAEVRVTGSPVDRVHVLGTAGADVVPVIGSDGADTIGVIADGLDVAVSGSPTAPLARLSSVETVVASLGDGADHFSSVGNVAALTSLIVNGGDGPDTIMGGNGADVLAGGAGDDFIDGNQGIDAGYGDAGADTFQWDPGDSNDTFAGGAGVDRLAFNGSNGAEIVDIMGLADGRARLMRNLANIVLDFDDIEVAQVRMFGSADFVRVADVSGTDLDTVDVDLFGFGGVDDAQIDEVTVGTGVTIGRDSTAAVVEGLGAQLRVVGSPADRVHVVGTAALETVRVLGTGGVDEVFASADGTGVAVSGATPGVFARFSQVETLDIELGDGADRFGAVGNLAALTTLQVEGGDGADTLTGSNGADLLVGDAGDDVIDGNQGIDALRGEAGLDTFQWDPGDGNDAIAGGADADRMVFNGSAASEIMEVTGMMGGHVRFTRNIANIVLDLDEVETLDVNNFGSTDLVTVGDLTGTDMTAVDVDLALFGGADDVAVDDVVVRGTAGDDVVTVVEDGTGVAVQGLHAIVRVTGAAPAMDRLTVEGLEGDDTVTATPGAAARILLALLP